TDDLVDTEARLGGKWLRVHSRHGTGFISMATLTPRGVDGYTGRYMRPRIALLALGATLVVSACSATVTQRPLLVPAPGSPIAVGNSPGSIALGDVNGDGKLDLVVAGKSGVTPLLGWGDGRFRAVTGGR